MSKNSSHRIGIATREVKAGAGSAVAPTAKSVSDEHPAATARLRAMLTDPERPSLFADPDSLILAIAGKAGKLRATQVVFVRRVETTILEDLLYGDVGRLFDLIRENWPVASEVGNADSEREGLGKSLAELDGESS